jgi:hypothetical protein
MRSGIHIGRTENRTQIMDKTPRLTSTVTAAQVQTTIDKWKAGSNEDRDIIVGVIRQRLEERFFQSIVPEDYWKGKDVSKSTAQNQMPHGFAVMSLACALIELLQAFQRGYASHDQATKKLFISFLDEDAFWGHGLVGFDTKNFYHDVRCGLLHRGETRNWTIWREARTAVDLKKSRLGAWKLMGNLHKSMTAYLDRLLADSTPHGDLWKNAIHKLEFGIIHNAVSDLATDSETKRKSVKTQRVAGWQWRP